MKKAALHNLGCKVNAYETQAMQEMLEKEGYEIVPFKEGADVYIINTCTVTNMADRKSRQMLHRAKKLNPKAIVVAAGCFVQVQGEDKKVDEAIDVLIGNNKKQDLIPILNAYWEKEEKNTEVNNQEILEKIDIKNIVDINRNQEYENLEITKTGEHTRAYLKVQDGCNQFCSYCIIPFARGRIRSRQLEDVVREVKALGANGYKEVVLTGIHLSSYGLDLQNNLSLIELIEEIEKIDGIKRIRLGSLEPRVITKEFVSRISKLEKFCPQFHLSLQSGCDETLKRMNRKYTSSEYKEACDLLRKYFSQLTFTTDIIVGFPGETQEEFEQTKAFVEGIDFYETHVFKYSKREGTKAATMENQVDEQIKSQRSSELIELGIRQHEKVNKSFFGKKVSVLIEEKIQKDGRNVYVGHTKEYMKCELSGEYHVNTIVDTII